MENFDANIFSFFDDDEFVRWATSPDEKGDAHWNAWLQKNPHRIDDLLDAKRIVQNLAKAQKTSAGPEKISTDIWENISLHIQQEQDVVPISKSYSSTKRYWIAASVAGLLVVASSLYFVFNANKKVNNNAARKIASTIINNDLQHTNSTSENRVVYLVDGTKITLQPGASIKHAVFLQKDKREVYLEGNAFFEVAKDANRPFYVYANDIVLRVLGTSFNVATNNTNGNVTVLVRTGKVSVYKNSNRENAAYVLTPNESVHYSAQNKSITKSESDAALSKASIISQNYIHFNFEEEQATKIFAVLEEAYGIHIQCDENIFSKCIITTALDDATFDEKLKIICEAINANYNIENNEVTIEGKGCK
ncbi:MAG TPA: FecR domain-containing protein [Puia sp.]|nr:FecR domain-containing protein [Puia sp.]